MGAKNAALSVQIRTVHAQETRLLSPCHENPDGAIIVTEPPQNSS